MISVVIPTYNSAKFIAETLDSVFRQTRLPNEVIVVDDASTDGTRELVTSIAVTAPVPVKLHVLHSNTGGPPAPLNAGIARAEGHLIALLDHDDVMLPEKLELQEESFTRNSDLGIVLSKLSTFKNNQQKEISPLNQLQPSDRVSLSSGAALYRVSSRNCYEALLQNSLAISCSNFFFPKNVWSACGGFDEDLRSCCDYAFLRSVARRYDIGVIDRVLFHYNWSEASLYRTARQLTNRQEHLQVLKGFDVEVLSDAGKKQLNHAVARQILAIAHCLREEGEYSHSFIKYLESMKLTGYNQTAVAGIAKLLPHKFMKMTGLRKELMP